MENKKKSPLIEGSFRFDHDSIIVSACNENGGLFHININEEHSLCKKVINGDCRGIAKYQQGYVLASNEFGILLLNSDFQVVNNFVPSRLMDYHGVAINGSKAYIVESASNTVGIFALPTLERIDEIVLDSIEEDILHINDIFIEDEQIYLSMFSYSGKWREKPADSGVIIKMPFNDYSMRDIIFQKLKHPHSIIKYKNNTLYCNSADFEVMENAEIIFKGIGYLRGLVVSADTYYIGQSRSRNVDRVIGDKTNVSLDAGFHVFNRAKKISKFIPLPVSEIYNIIISADIQEEKDFDISYDFKNDDSDIKLIGLCQLFIDSENGYNENESVKRRVNKGNNKVEIDLGYYKNIISLRFDPANNPCIIIVNSILLEFEHEKKVIDIINHNAQESIGNKYIFDTCDPQFYLPKMEKKPSKIIIDFDYDIF